MNHMERITEGMRLLAREGFFELVLITVLVVLNSGSKHAYVVALASVMIELFLALKRTAMRRKIPYLTVAFIALQIMLRCPEMTAQILSLCLNIGYR